jgi:hypothetical protein
MEINVGSTVRTRHGDVLRVVEFIDNDELRMWKCDNGTAYIEEDLEVIDERAGERNEAEQG